ncbi:related to dna mismatch repair homologue (hpms2) [Cephalotrichum gorgonifer]|uniref:Related to dna mismatch repair homologue (Hpms2) n=1 Tax=Cephalotrichum gorgonifer TaxID=2041049 RepID=A0AAE8N167_9PEZI|nr:related to dna mismatch repair homologue (hpms2) [Cephalotrichum gorgonifer]
MTCLDGLSGQLQAVDKELSHLQVPSSTSIVLVLLSLLVRSPKFTSSTLHLPLLGPPRNEQSVVGAMSIRPLPRHVAQQIKSSVTITSLNDTVNGLVKNALDAEASTVNIYLDYARGNCTVEDNGIGIPPSEFHPDGGLAKPHHTSKFDYPYECHGSNGDFLAAVAALSLLGITSHHRQHHSHNSLAVHHSAIVSRHTPSLPEQRLVSFSHGTRISVRDLFGSIPVRAKLRPAAGDRASIEKEWRLLLRNIVGLLLPWPGSVSVYIKETNAGLELRFRLPQAQTSGSTPASHDLVSRVSRILTQSNLADAADAESWETVGASAGGMSVIGCISLNPVATRRSQFICLGIQPIPSDSGSNVLYEEINRLFAASSFALDDDASKGQGSKGSIFGRKPKRGIDRWPMFYFRIDLTGQKDACHNLDQFLDQGHRVGAVIDLLKAICYEFLRKHHFNPRPNHLSIERRQSRSRDSSPSSGPSTAPTRPKKKTSPGVGRSPFDMWSRVKAGTPVTVTKSDPNVAPPTSHKDGLGRREHDSPLGSEPLLSREGKLLRPPFPEALGPTEAKTFKATLPSGTPSAPGPGSAAPATPGAPPELEDSRAEQPSNPLQSGSNQPSEWVADILKTWVNPVFAPVQPAIPKTYEDTLLSGATSQILPPGTPSTAPLQSRISRHALLSAEVISQVDKKFILIKLPPAAQDPPPADDDDPSLLVLIDQHAADERCHLEELTRAYFSLSGRAASDPLPEPIRFEVPRREGALLLRFREHFARWGVAYGVARTEVTVLGLPPSILERCRQEPRLLIELLRAEIWKLDERGALPPGPSSSGRGEAGDTGGEWVRLFNGCPAGILDLLNSRACRSAIMFNDPLSRDECVSLVSRLASCALPFQCAHGRPSMVPLLDLGRGPPGDVSAPVSFKSWLER